MKWDVIVIGVGPSGLTSDEDWIRSRELQGLSLRDVVLTVKDGRGKSVVQHRGDMIFTHFGLSGPAALRCSGFVLRTLLKTKLPERAVPLMLRLSGADGGKEAANVPKTVWSRLAESAKGLPVKASGTLSIEEAFITGGGVSIREVDPRTIASKLMPGLYFCDEVLDIHGYTGGYNITAAFATGHAAGTAAAEASRQAAMETGV